MAGTNYTSKAGGNNATADATTYTTYDDYAIHEELSDIIYDISPTDTPFLSAIGKGSVGNTVFDWQTDQLADAAANRKVEGATIADASQSTTRRLTNYTQISSKTVKTTATTEAVGTAGRKSELAYQLAKAGKEIKRDMESMFLSDAIASAGTASTARSTRGFVHFVAEGLDANHIINCDNNATTWATAGNLTDADTFDRDRGSNTYEMSSGSGTAVQFVEADLLELMQDVWTSGGEPSKLYMGATAKNTFSTAGNFDGRASSTYAINQDASDKSVYNVVDVYVSDFGTVTAEIDRFCTTTAAYLADPSTWSVEYLRPFQTKDLPSSADGDSKYMIAEYGLKCTTPEANGAMINIA